MHAAQPNIFGLSRRKDCMSKEPKSRAEAIEYLEKQIETALEVARTANLGPTTHPDSRAGFG
jgi:hypothetical protein